MVTAEAGTRTDSAVAARRPSRNMRRVHHSFRLAQRPGSLLPLSCFLLAVLLTAGCVSAGHPPANLGQPATDAGFPGAGPVTRGDWFTKWWNERRAAFAKSVRADRGAVVFLGDSITHGWGDDVGGSFPGLKVANRGIGGDTSRGVLYRLPEDVLAVRPRAVVLLIGTNDIHQGAEPEVVTGNVKLILAALRRENPKMPVVLCAVFPSSSSKQRPAERIQRLNELYKAAVKDDPRVTFIDTWSIFADAQGDAKPGEFPDLLHPNPAGYAKFADALRPVFRKLGLLPDPERRSPLSKKVLRLI